MRTTTTVCVLYLVGYSTLSYGTTGTLGAPSTVPPPTLNPTPAQTQPPTHPAAPSQASPPLLSSNLKMEEIHVADSKKTKSQIKTGLVIGGDRAINHVLVKDIRFSSQPGFERIVIDLEGNQNGESAAIPRPPYYQVEVSPDQSRIGVSIWGQPKLAFDPKKVAAVFKKSVLLKPITLLPRIEDDVWTFGVPLKTESTIEVFELSQPVRIIVDITKKRS